MSVGASKLTNASATVPTDAATVTALEAALSIGCFVRHWTFVAVLHVVVMHKTPANATVAVQSLPTKFNPRRARVVPPVDGRFGFCICVTAAESNVNACK